MRALRAARSQLAAKPSRILATVLAVVIGVGFACAAMVFTSTFNSDLSHKISAEYSGADLVVDASDVGATPEMVRRVAALPDVAAAEPLYRDYVDYRTSAVHGSMTIQTAAQNSRLRWTALESGRWPESRNEIALSRSAATGASLTVGSEVTLVGADGAEFTTTVVGVVDASASPLAGDRMLAFAPPATFVELGQTYIPRIAIVARPDVSIESLRSAVAQVATADGPVMPVNTTADQATTDVQSYTGQSDALAVVLLGFAAIALLVAGIVIANTFTILLTQRRRHIALLRCVGATRKQVRAEVLIEAGIIGAVGSLLGGAAGIGVGWAGASIAKVDSGGVAIPAVSLVVAVLIGIAMTVGAALLPASRAMKVAPLVALRPVADASEGKRSGRVRVVTAALLAGGGGAAMAMGVANASLPIAVVGGAFSAVGVLLLMRSLIPPLLWLIGAAVRVTGVSGRLAVANATRNPGRAAATSAALVVGVGLIVMLQVAAASVGASIDKATADRYPVDMVVAGDGSSLASGLVDSVAQTSGVTGAIGVPGAVVTFGSPEQGDGDEEASITLLGAPTAANQIVRGGLSELHSDNSTVAPTVLVPGWWIDSGRAALGDVITLTSGTQSEKFTVAVGRLTDSGVTSGDTLVTTEAALDRLAPHVSAMVVWSAVDQDADASTVVSELNTLVANQPSVYVYGAVADRGSMQAVLGTVTTVATGLLAVAVVIAIVGIGNTIGLSVAERTRESALLRALGLRRGQLRLMLALEALLLATVGALVGLVLGLVYGWAGAATTFQDIGRELVLTIPWDRVGAVLLLAVAAGALASVLPARRAVKAMPVAALAEE